MALTIVRSSLDQLIQDRAPSWTTSLRTKGGMLHLHPPDQEVLGDFDPIQLGIGLDALASWRGEVAEPMTQTRVGWRTNEASCEILWEEYLADNPSGSTVPQGDPRPSRPPIHRRPRIPWCFLYFRGFSKHTVGASRRTANPRLRIEIRWPQFPIGS